MKETSAIAIILAVGIGVSLLLKNYIGIAIAAFGIPAYLAYTAREQNILAKSRLYDRDLFLMIGISIVVILVFNYFLDPRIGLIALAIVVPLLALYADRLKAGKKAQKA
ncbi:MULTISPECIES: hypothetical protein [Thermococcus]|uniref:Uncharacterized protein n=1 Tax=Thermococcus nautili TaxID=195522 RepID=W8P7F8_9EURY|nr:MULTISPECIES: hypothetical protein [Thermococcus]AHL23515.1 hypothetical protein BD01_1913 [Thermococcus nautili]NJE49711.1 hypothetical protein [Thermococcus sp. 9N3]CAI1492765.1 conserved membrane protein of unknown function [Thermococcus nautili]